MRLIKVLGFTLPLRYTPLPNIYTSWGRPELCYPSIRTIAQPSPTWVRKLSTEVQPGSKQNYPQTEQWTPPPVVQRAVTGLLNDAFKNGTFSWNFTLSACLSSLLQALLYEKFPSESPAIRMKRLMQLDFDYIKLSENKGRIQASIIFPASRTRPQRLVTLVEHDDPMKNANDVVKYIYVLASRHGRTVLPDPHNAASSNITKAHEPNHVSLWSIANGFQGLGSYYTKTKHPTMWKMAVLAAGITVPNTNFASIDPFLASSLPDHLHAHNSVATEPPVEAARSVFINALLCANDATPQERATSLNGWAKRLETYFHCTNAGCGSTRQTTTEMIRHLRSCRFATETIASAQARMAAKVFQCSYCDMCFRRKSEMVDHVRQCHQKFERFACPEGGCESTGFETLNSFMSHYRKYHLFEGRVACPFCPGKSLSSPDALKNHLSFVHHELSRAQQLEITRHATHKHRTERNYRDVSDKLQLRPIGPLLAPYKNEGLWSNSIQATKGSNK